MAEQRGLRYLDLEPKGYSPYAGGQEFIKAAMPPPVRAAGMLAHVIAGGAMDALGIEKTPAVPGYNMNPTSPAAWYHAMTAQPNPLQKVDQQYLQQVTRPQSTPALPAFEAPPWLRGQS